MSDYIFDTENVVEFESPASSIYNGGEEDKMVQQLTDKNRQINSNCNGSSDDSSNGLLNQSYFREYGRPLTSSFQSGIERTRMNDVKLRSSSSVSERPRIVPSRRSSCDQIRDKFIQQLQPFYDFRADVYKRSLYECGTEANDTKTSSAYSNAVTQNVRYLGSNSIDTSNTSVEICGNKPSPRRFVISEDTLLNDRERHRRENHNQLEKTRRTFINDKIAELGKMLHENDHRPLRQRKGTILKETVDYVKKLKLDLQQIKEIEGRICEHDIEFQKISARLERVESIQASNMKQPFEKTEKDTTNESSTLDGYPFSAQATNEMFCTQGADIRPDNILQSFTNQEVSEDELNVFSVTLADETSPSLKFVDTLSNFF